MRSEPSQAWGEVINVLKNFRADFETLTGVEGKNYSDIPVWRRYTLTIEEAARYYHIGEGKLRTLIDTHPNEDFYVMNGNRALIKREKFERYLDQATAV